MIITRGHKCKFFKKRVEPRRTIFSALIVVRKWNSLDEKAVTVKTINGFKNDLEDLGYKMLRVIFHTGQYLINQLKSSYYYANIIIDAVYTNRIVIDSNKAFNNVTTSFSL